MWNLSLLDPDPLLAIARTFTAGGPSKYAGRCGEKSFQSAPGLRAAPCGQVGSGAEASRKPRQYLLGLIRQLMVIAQRHCIIILPKEKTHAVLSKLVAGVALCTTAIIGLVPINSTRLFAEGRATNPQNAMGNAPCVWLSPIENPDHTLDVPRTIELLKKNEFGCQAMPIAAKPPYDWAGFQQLVAAADKAGIDTWPVLIPPSEGGNSLPYERIT